MSSIGTHEINSEVQDAHDYIISRKYLKNRDINRGGRSKQIFLQKEEQTMFLFITYQILKNKRLRKYTFTWFIYKTLQSIFKPRKKRKTYKHRKRMLRG